jgi:hypothetical protein
MTRPLFWAGSVFLLTGAAFCALDAAAAFFVSAAGVACVVWLSGLNRLRQFVVLVFCWLVAIGYCWVWPVWFTMRLSRFASEPLPAAVTVTKVDMQGRQYRYTGRAAFYTVDKEPSADIVLTSFVDLGVLPGEQTACIGSLSFGATLRELAALSRFSDMSQMLSNLQNLFIRSWRAWLPGEQNWPAGHGSLRVRAPRAD